MALQFNRTDADTGHVYTVYARIDGGTVLVGETTAVVLDLYDSVGAAAGGLKPVLPPDLPTFTATEMTAANPTFVTALTNAINAGTILSPSDALQTAMYTLLKQRATYAGAVDV